MIQNHYDTAGQPVRLELRGVGHTTTLSTTAMTQPFLHSALMACAT